MEVTAKERQQVEEQVEQLLSGQGSEVTLCDLGLELSKPATLRKNVTYIVCGVIFNEQEEVLMVQEAKPDCYKQWYLPAGRVEVGESLEEALRREVSPACHHGNGNSAFGHLILSAAGEGGGGLRLPANHVAADPGTGTAVDPLHLLGPHHRRKHEDADGCGPGVSAGVLVGQTVQPVAQGAGHPAPHRLRTQVPPQPLARRLAASGPELPPHRPADAAAVRRSREAGLDPAGPSSDPPPAHGGGPEDPRRDVGGQHGGAGGAAGVVLQPRRRHAGRPQPAAQRPAARPHRRRLLQHAGRADARPAAAGRGRPGGGAAGAGHAPAGGEPALRLDGGPGAGAEGGAAAAEPEPDPAPDPEPLLTPQEVTAAGLLL
ncbi:8-oxo-dGDP phosphatase NUDT18 isoform X1 [Poecilia latipinna]|uniref:8-oxo-dGDP phosphatase NUDT18 isoform X1 n=1 Tax=Poecilia latipinna TaxID=48699 RepID=UPI00072EA635|nr:PREDICTED: 8-oxo-dGDP phosphatase NUDT18 isoform X1 [Poecilia latipinna]XP_014875075.1 PREDICTED: 8-oxo-dGDP phosphatase NUDT18 isoform X1 [Poecilia latipinna]